MAKIYGMGWYQGTRFGGFRPNVFFYTGLELGLWMTAASLAGWWLWRCGAIKKIGPIPLRPDAAADPDGDDDPLPLDRGAGPAGLGMMVLWLLGPLSDAIAAGRACCWRGPCMSRSALPNLWSGQQAVDLATALVGPVRAESLEYRFKCENLLIEKAIEQPIFGWGGWGRSYGLFLCEHAMKRDRSRPTGCGSSSWGARDSSV